MRERSPVGPRRLLICGYAVFVVAALGRGVEQLATHPARAPLAYALSLLAAGSYAVALGLLARGRDTAARRWCAVELTGVLAVGTWTLIAPASFPDATVWSVYGTGYAFVPLLLPVLAIRWLGRTPARPAATMEACRR